MSSKYWLLFGLLALSSTQFVNCTAEFSSCEAKLNCPKGGASGMAGTPEAGAGGEAGADEGGSGGLDAHAGQAGAADNAGTGGVAGDSSVDTDLEIAPPTFAAGKTYVPFTGKISASGAAQYSWSVTSGALPAGLTLQSADKATVTIAGTATEAGQFPIGLSVTDGSTTKAIDLTLVITHSALFLSDRNAAGVNELF
jgi:large repetitive protein